MSFINFFSFFLSVQRINQTLEGFAARARGQRPLHELRLHQAGRAKRAQSPSIAFQKCLPHRSFQKRLNEADLMLFQSRLISD